MFRLLAVLTAALVISGCQTSVRFFEPTKTTYERRITGTDRNDTGGVKFATWAVENLRLLGEVGEPNKSPSTGSYEAEASLTKQGYKGRYDRRPKTHTTFRYREKAVRSY